MIHHTLHLPKRSRQHIEIRTAKRPGECDYCHRGTVKNCQCDSCGTWFPSPLSEIPIEKLRAAAALRRKAERTEFRPRYDGITDRDPAAHLDREDNDNSIPWRD